MLTYKKKSSPKTKGTYRKISTSIRCIMPILILLTTSCVADVVNELQNNGHDRTATGAVTASAKQAVLEEMNEAWFYYLLASQLDMTSDPTVAKQEQAYIATTFLSEWNLGLTYINSIVLPPGQAPTLSVQCPI